MFRTGCLPDKWLNPHIHVGCLVLGIKFKVSIIFLTLNYNPVPKSFNWTPSFPHKNHCTLTTSIFMKHFIPCSTYLFSKNFFLTQEVDPNTFPTGCFTLCTPHHSKLLSELWPPPSTWSNVCQVLLQLRHTHQGHAEQSAPGKVDGCFIGLWINYLLSSLLSGILTMFHNSWFTISF